MGFCCAGPGRPQGRRWSRGLIHRPRNKHQRRLSGMDEMALSPSPRTWPRPKSNFLTCSTATRRTLTAKSKQAIGPGLRALVGGWRPFSAWEPASWRPRRPTGSARSECRVVPAGVLRSASARTVLHHRTGAGRTASPWRPPAGSCAR